MSVRLSSKPLRRAIGIACLVAAMNASVSLADPAKLGSVPPASGLVASVNVMQGTNSVREFSHGNTLPHISPPWAMTDWSLQNYGDVNERFFFQSKRNSFVGIRMTHQPSPWAGDYGHMLIAPQSGPILLRANSRATPYDAASTTMRPDYLRVRLDKYKVTTEMTTSERGAIWRLAFDPDVKTGRLVFEMPGERQAQLRAKGNRVWGYTKYHGGHAAGDFHCYFVAELDRPVTRVMSVGGDDRPGSGAGYIEFATDDGKSVEMRFATSFISPEQAQINLARETKDGFEAMRTKSETAWNELLGRITLEGDAERKQTFYTCLWRTLKYPRKAFEIDADGKVVHYSPWNGKVEPGVIYTDTGLWDTYRTLFPFLSIVYPEQFGEICEGWMNAYREGGWLPNWPNPGGFRAMPGNHSNAMLADAMVKGIKGFDYETAYAALRKDGFEVPPRTGLAGGKGAARDYFELGYVPARGSEYWVSMSLDYAYNDWCIAQAAKLMGKTDDYEQLMRRSLNYTKLWDAEHGFMRSKDRDGSWSEPTFDEFYWGGPYTESGPWQASWSVQHDILGLADLLGGREGMIKKLDHLFDQPPKFNTGAYGHVIHEMAEFAAVNMGQYGACNQPSFHIPYMYASLGQPWKTEYWTRRACRELFNAGPNGFSGDDDNGSNAAWYMLSSIGLYPLTPGTPQYVFTSPEFDAVTIHLPTGKQIEIRARDNSKENVYVQSRTVNGKSWTSTFITHAELIDGVKIETQQGAKPVEREVRAAELPYSLKTELAGKSE